MARSFTDVLRVLCVVAAVAAAGCRGASPAGDDPRAFFAGRTLTYIVATEAGGGYDTYGRLVSQYIGQRLGVRTVVVKNIPGGGHIVGTNELYRARPDGLTLGMFNSGLIYAQLLGRPGFHARLDQMSWIGKAGGEPRLLVTSKQSGFRSLDQLRRARRPILMAAGGVGTEGYLEATLLSEAIGLQTKVVLGLATRDAQLSMMRGETEAQFVSASTGRPLLDGGYGYSIMRLGSGVGVSDELPDAASVVTTDAGRRLVALIQSVVTLSRWTAGPPGIPAERLAVLRAAHAAALSDPAFLAAAKKLDLPIQPMGGAALADAVARVLHQPAETLALLNAADSR
ncbi:MAG TPA: tripartite tricarboxylate transporter substrate-binding protein [Vicinamibacterales bacterium]|jgi:tripartite-type tricarboxylate transporter receptor subunit TctC|nr:tripartite tricarboxylate transporter substrate-binding protein [Vicinamibacterales bacterium]